MPNFDDYVKQGDRRAKEKGNRKPFVLKFGGEEPDIVIAYPDAVKQMDYEEANTANQQLQVLMRPGDFLRLREKLRGKDVEVAKGIIQDIWETWGDDSGEVPGGKELSES